MSPTKTEVKKSQLDEESWGTIIFMYSLMFGMCGCFIRIFYLLNKMMGG